MTVQNWHKLLCQAKELNFIAEQHKMASFAYHNSFAVYNNLRHCVDVIFIFILRMSKELSSGGLLL